MAAPKVVMSNERSYMDGRITSYMLVNVGHDKVVDFLDEASKLYKEKRLGCANAESTCSMLHIILGDKKKLMRRRNDYDQELKVVTPMVLSGGGNHQIWFDLNIKGHIAARLHEYEARNSDWKIESIRHLQIFNFAQTVAVTAEAMMILSLHSMSLYELRNLSDASPQMLAMAREVAAAHIGDGNQLSERLKTHSAFEIDQILDRFGPFVRHLELSSSMNTTAELNLYEKHCKNINSMMIVGRSLDARHEAALAKIMRTVTKLSLRHCNLLTMRAIDAAPLLHSGLEELEIDNCSRHILMELEHNFPKLRTLKLNLVPIAGSFCESLLSSFIDRHPQLTTLELKLGKGWDFQNGLSSVLKLRDLICLKMRADFQAAAVIQRNVTDTSGLAQMRHLNTLCIDCNGASIAPFLRVTRSDKILRTLEVRKTDIGHEFYDALSRLTALTSLHLIDVNLSAGFGADRAALPQYNGPLTHLTIEGDIMGGEHADNRKRIDTLLKFIAKLEKIENVTLINVGFALKEEHLPIIGETIRDNLVRVFAYDYTDVPQPAQTLLNLSARYTSIPMPYCPIEDYYSSRVRRRAAAVSSTSAAAAAGYIAPSGASDVYELTEDECDEYDEYGDACSNDE